MDRIVSLESSSDAFERGPGFRIWMLPTEKDFLPQNEGRLETYLQLIESEDVAIMLLENAQIVYIYISVHRNCTVVCICGLRMETSPTLWMHQPK
jgi:hypothetical protein